jgi:VWFA-related protein
MKKIFPAVLLIALFSVQQFGQNPPPPPPLPADDKDVVKISTTLIQIDVTVTDKNGKPVRDLRPDEIEIYENGKLQEITNFSFISNVREKSVEPAEKKRTENAAAAPEPPPTVRPEQVRRAIALVVDDLSLSFESVHFVRRALKKFVDEQMQDGDLVAIIRTGAGIGALQQFTTDRRQLYAAIERVRWNPAGKGGMTAFAPIQGVAGDFVESGTDPAADDDRVDASVSDIETFRESVFTTGTLGAIGYIVRGMEELPGRKSVMLFSDGFPLNPRSRNGFSDSRLILDSVEKLIEAANRAGVVIYTTDARGLQTTGLTAADSLAQGAFTGKNIWQMQQDYGRLLSVQSQLIFETQSGLHYLARETGGLAFVNNNDLSGGIRKMLDDQSYYLIGYEPEGETFDPEKRRFNKLEVKVKREGVRVRYRSGFFGVTDEQIAAVPKTPNATPEQKIKNALTSPFAANEIPLRLNALFGNDAKQGSYIHSFLHIDAEQIAFPDAPGGKKHARFDILAVGFGDNGVPVESIGKTFTANVSEEVYKWIKKRGIVYDFIFPMKKAGAYQLRVVIHDGGSGRVGSANQFVEVPDIDKKRLTLSGIVVENTTLENWQRAGSGQTDDLPTNPLGDMALRQFKTGTVLNYGAVIYNARLANGRPDLTAQMRIFKDGKLFFEGRPNKVPVSDIKDPKRINVLGSLVLGTEMTTGEYVLQIVVTDRLAKKKRQFAAQFVPFEIIE